MQSLKAAAMLLAAASLCASCAPPAAARQQPAAAPKELRFEFEGNRLFTSEQLRRTAAQCYEGRRDRDKGLDTGLIEYCLRGDVLDVMRRAGYARARTGEPRTASLGGVLTVTTPVEENELYRVGRVTIEGAFHFDAKQLRELLPLKRGDIADGYAAALWASEHLKAKYVDEGFLQYEADLEPEYRLAPGAPEGAVDLTVTIREGSRFTLRRVEFVGAEGTPEGVLREALGLKEGEFFRQQEYSDGVASLNEHELFEREGGRFERVDRDEDVELRADDEAAELDIKIHLTERGKERAARRATAPGADEGEGGLGRPAPGRRP